MTLREKCRSRAGELKKNPKKGKTSIVISAVIEQGQACDYNDCAGRYARYSKFAP